MERVDNNRNVCSDSIYVSELNTVYEKLKTFRDSRLNFSRLDDEIESFNTQLDKAWKDFYDRSSPFALIRKDILSKEPDDIDRLILHGLQLHENNKLDSAYQYFSEALKKDSARLNNYFLLIYAELTLNNNTEKALDYVDKVIDLDKNQRITAYNPYVIRANIFINQKKYKPAYDDINFLLEKDSNDLMSLFGRAYVKTKLNDYTGSISDYQALLKKYQCIPFRIYLDTSMIFNNIGWNYYLLKQYEQCVEYASKSLFLKQNFPNALATRGSGYYGLCEYDKCIVDMTKAIELAPDLDNAYYLRGLSYLKSNKPDLAYFDLSIALKLGVADAAEAMKGLSRPKINPEVENQRQLYRGKPTKSKSSFLIDPYGIHLYF